MSAIIGNNVQMKEILKATGYDCPAGLEGKTFNEAVSGGGGSGITVEPITITQNGTTTAPSGKAYSPITVNVPKEVVLNVPVLPDGRFPYRFAVQRREVHPVGAAPHL